MYKFFLSSASTWRASNYSMFWGKTLAFGYKHRLGTKIPPLEQRPIQTDEKPLIEAYDFRKDPIVVRKSSQFKEHIRDQGNCGASWAFSTVDVATDRAVKVHNGTRSYESASVQMLISCVILGNNANGCSAASIDIGWRFIERDSVGKNIGGSELFPFFAFFFSFSADTKQIAKYNLNRLVSESCYPYESGESGVAPQCKVHAYAKRPVCPSTGEIFTKPMLNVGPVYPIQIETSVNLFIH